MSETPNNTRRAIMKAMGEAGILAWPEVAERSGVCLRAVRNAHNRTTVETLEKIAVGLGGVLKIEIVFPPT